MTLTLRPASPADAVAAGSICHAAFRTIAERHGFPPDFPDAPTAIGLIERLLSMPEAVHAVVADLDGRVVGSNFLWEWDRVAGVGPITIDPAMQNGGIGRRLMEAVLDRARGRGIGAVRLLQAGYHMRSLSLYTQLGFVVREPVLLMQGAALGVGVAGHAVRVATEADLGAAAALCQRVHGHDRNAELRSALQQGTATVVEYDGRLTGYASDIGFFGHAVGETAEDVKALIGAAPAFSGPGFLLPARDVALLPWCLAQGLLAVQPMTLMSLGPYNEPQGAFLPSILY